MSAPSVRYQSLDLWRGVAALWVCLYHAYLPLIGRPAPVGFLGLQRIAGIGNFGVQIFFVISGFCIGVRARQEWLREADGRAFLLDRLARIFPVYHAAFLLTILLGILLFPISQGQWFATAKAPGVFPASVGDLFKSLSLTELYWGKFPTLRVSWTLTAELTYYLVIALGLWLARATGRPSLIVIAGFLLALTTAALPTDNLTSFGSNTVAGWRHFFCGLLVSCVLVQPRSTVRVAVGAIAGIVLLGLAGWYQSADYWRGWVPSLLALALMALWSLDATLTRLPALHWLQFCGAISYSLYLIHDPIVSRLTRFGLRSATLPEPLLFALPLAGSVLAVVAARAFFHFVEAPVEVWRKGRRTRQSLGVVAPALS